MSCELAILIAGIGMYIVGVCVGYTVGSRR
jgi:hypothetical protein